MSLISIDTQDIADWHGPETPATARLVANQQFITSEGILIAPGDGLWQEIAVSVVSNKIRIAASSVYSTTDSDTPFATYTLSIYSDKGKLLLSLPVAIRIPATPSSTTWTAILEYSQASFQAYRSAYYNTDQINVLLAAMLSNAAFDSSWDGVTNASPTKNAVFDVVNPLWQTINKSGEEPRSNSAVLGPDSELIIPVVTIGRNYVFELGVWYDTPASADFQFSIDFPSSNGIFYRGETTAPDGTVSQLTGNGTGTFPAISITSATDGGGMVFIRAMITNVVAIGNIRFLWAQNTSNSTPTRVVGGSFLRFPRL